MTLSFRPGCELMGSLLHSVDTSAVHHQWVPEELEALERCIVCGAQPLATMYDGLERHGEGRWRIDQCPRCRVALLNPRPTASAIMHAYPTSYPPYSQLAARPKPASRREQLTQ